MRGLTVALSFVALIGLSACEEQTLTLTVGGTGDAPAGPHLNDCLELQRAMEDQSLPLFTRNGMRDRFHDKDCVYRSQDAGVSNLLAPS